MKFRIFGLAVIAGFVLTSVLKTDAQVVGKDPVIIVPGIIGSWNADVILKNKSGGEWDFIPLDHTYDNLINAFEDEGFTLNHDLFIAFYDWRKSNINSAEDYLIPVIDEALENSTTGKVDIVAHSMGGLVVRRYIQSESYRNDVDDLVLLGTPNQGSSDVYTLWEGGAIPNNWERKQKLILDGYLNYMTVITGQTGDSFDTIRQHVTSVGELLPIYDFLVDKETGETKFIDDISTPNEFLYGLLGTTKNLARINGTLTVVHGKGQGTVETIPVVARDSGETKLWADGIPSPLTPERNSTDGDNRVLLSSAKINKNIFLPVLPVRNNERKSWLARLFTIAHAWNFEEGGDNVDDFVKNITLDSKHGDLPTVAIPEILAVLGLNAPSTEFVPPAEPDNIVSFWFASPVQIKITDPLGRSITKDSNEIPGALYDGETDPNGVKMVIIENPAEGEYKVELAGTANGHYHMAVSEYTDAGDQTTIVEKDVVNGERVSYTVTVDGEVGSELSVSEPTIEMPEEPADQTAAELIEGLLQDVHGYYESEVISKKSIYKQLVGDLERALSFLVKAKSVEENNSRVPQTLKQFQILAFKKVALLAMNTFKFKVVTHKNKSIDAFAADDMERQAKEIILKLQTEGKSQLPTSPVL